MQKFTRANCRPIFPTVMTPAKKIHGSQDRMYRKSGEVYLHTFTHGQWSTKQNTQANQSCNDASVSSMSYGYHSWCEQALKLLLLHFVILPTDYIVQTYNRVGVKLTERLRCKPAAGWQVWRVLQWWLPAQSHCVNDRTSTTSRQTRLPASMTAAHYSQSPPSVGTSVKDKSYKSNIVFVL